ncbi:unnamed protein product [Cyprideis torosa]|uniref:Sulfide:quinone oxidoreductase, mitochondrial n=1 Tax=Cyprideis torosa TaxID=163714 RepID=A0A7R8WLT1_9CRUS|nr:unnamed protein product [Cyprideis torosa]CAG0904678.1 unnamed protein product [Cyprideis torosa]
MNPSLLKNLGTAVRRPWIRSFSITAASLSDHHFKLLVVGGGSGGCAVASRFTRSLDPGDVGIVEPADSHFYQPMWTLVGAGLKTLEQSRKPMRNVLPKKATWIQDQIISFDPDISTVWTVAGRQITYQYMVVAMGLQLNYSRIPGLVNALQNDDRVCSNYSQKYVTKTFPAIQELKSGNALFVFPNSPIKCAGAPQKIMYLADWILKKEGRRSNVNIIYLTPLPVLFGVKKYCEALEKIVAERNIRTVKETELVRVNHHKSEAVFNNLKDGSTEAIEYSFLHVPPPMSAPDPLKDAPTGFTDATGFLNVSKNTLQHLKYPNIFGIGDCTNLPCAKTAAAAATQVGVLFQNLQSVMEGESASIAKYEGYTSCPLLVGYNKCIMAEFDYDLQPLETFPVDQSIPRFSMYLLKKDIMPQLYWHLMTKGYWTGPGPARRLMHLQFIKAFHTETKDKNEWTENTTDVAQNYQRTLKRIKRSSVR